MKITLVRHGQTESNYSGICQGVSNVLLNDTGRRQAYRLKEEIKDKQYDVCFTSPLVRAVETAMILIGDRVQMVVDKRLIDRNLGELEGKSRSEYDSKKYWDYTLNYDAYGVEPVQDIFKRCNEFLEYLFSKEYKEVLIVAHSASIRAIRHLLLKSDLSKNLLTNNIENCYFEEIEVDEYLGKTF